MRSLIIINFSILFLLVFVKKSSAQQYSINGIVYDSTGKRGVPNVHIRARYSQSSTTSSVDGTFYLKLNATTDTLVTSLMGFQNAVMPVIAGHYTIMTLESVQNTLPDVIINTGYQTIKPNESNGSFAVIDNKMLNQQVGLNILDRLNGVSSSVLFNMGKNNNNPQNSTNISIRGLSTINGPLDPLIILDNFIYEGNITNINPNDVESVTILKDAAAASIWGARAGNGVIVITTKKGRFRQKVSLDFNNTLSIQNRPDLYKLPQMSSEDYIDIEQMLFNKGYFDNQLSAVPFYQALTPAVEVFLARKNGTISTSDSTEAINLLKQIDGRNQYLRYVYRKALTQQYALNLHGGSENIAWLVSGAFDKMISALDAPFSRASMRTQNTYKPMKRMTLQLAANYNLTTSASGLNGYGAVQYSGRRIPYVQLADSKGNPLSVDHQYRKIYTDTAGAGKLLNWDYLPLEDYKHAGSKSTTENLTALLSLQYTLLDGLDIDMRYQYQRQEDRSQSLYDEESYYARNLINLYSQLNRETGAINYIVPVGSILDKSYSALTSWNARSQLNYNNQIGTNHKIAAMMGMEVRSVKTGGYGTRFYGYNEDPSTAVNVDVVNRYPTFITGSMSSIGGNSIPSSTSSRFVSEFANVAYIYKNRYTISASSRRDGANIFGANTNDKWKPLWSAGLGWELSREEFYRIKWLPHLRLTITTGASGNVDNSKTANSVATAAINNVSQLPILRITTLNNPSLRWEQSLQTNFKIDFASQDDIIRGSVEYYRKKGTDLYAPAPYDYTTWGYQQYLTRNVADMEGHGWDIQLNTNNLRGIIRWNTQLLFNYNLSKTSKYYLNSSGYDVSGILGGGGSIWPVEGFPLYAISAYRWGGLDKEGNPQGYIGEEKTTDYQAIYNNAVSSLLQGGSIKYIGSANPLYFGSILNTISWRNFSLSFNLTFKLGYYLLKPSLNYSGIVSGTSVGSSDYNRRWMKAGDENYTNVPSFQYPINSDRDGFYNNAEINVIKGDHIRCQFVNLSYSLPTRKASLFNAFEVYGNVSNVGILWRANKDKIDPDYINVYPNPVQYTLGFKTQF